MFHSGGCASPADSKDAYRRGRGSPCLGLVSHLRRNSAHAPRSGSNVNRTVDFPGGTCTARKIALARKTSVSLPSMVARHHGCQTSLSTSIEPEGEVTSTTTSVLV